MPPDRTADRHDPSVARELIEWLIADADVRRIYLTRLADTIQLAHRQCPTSWGVTLFDTRLRLNVGMIEVLVIYDVQRIETRINYVLHDRTGGDAVWPVLETCGVSVTMNGFDSQQAVGGYRSVPGSMNCFFDVADLAVVDAAIGDYHVRLVEAATRTPRHTMTARAHSPGVIAYLRAELGREIPDPAYAMTEPAFDPAAVHLGCTVTLHFADDDAPMTFRVVESDGSQRAGTCSAQSPLGSAILGATVADTVTYAVADGIERVTIDAIIPRP